MLNMIVSGASGRMGSRIIILSQDMDEITLAGALERKDHKDLGNDIGKESYTIIDTFSPKRSDLPSIISLTFGKIKYRFPPYGWLTNSALIV